MDNRLIGDVIGKVFEIGEAHRRENAILRTLLLEQGLSGRKIDAELRKRLRQQKVRELAAETLERVSSKLADYFEKHDAVTKEQIISRVEKDRSRMN
jgi:uncharacterized membrane protein YccC